MTSFTLCLVPTFKTAFNNGLVGGFNPSEKYDRQIGSFPQVSKGDKSNIWNYHLVLVNWLIWFIDTHDGFP